MRQHALQRPATRRAADVTGAAVEAAQDARAGRRGRARAAARVPPHPGRRGAADVIESMGVWGQRWARGDVVAKQFDASPADVGHPPQHRWSTSCRHGASSCTSTCGARATGRATSGWCSTPRRRPVPHRSRATTSTSRWPVTCATMVDYWMGRIEFVGAVRAGDLWSRGRGRSCAALPTWFRPQLLRPGAVAAAGGCRWRVLACPRGAADRPLVPEEWVLRIDSVLGAAAANVVRSRPGSAPGGGSAGDDRPRLRRRGPAVPHHLPRRSPTR